jgi:hypothetical protein
MTFFIDHRLFRWVSRAGLGLFVLIFSNACKNTVKLNEEGPKTSFDYSYVKFATYKESQVLSAGQYTGESTRADVVTRALDDVKNLSSCKTGSQTTYCASTGGESVQWIQLFMPDGSSCGVGKIPEDVEIRPCLDNS